jgi:iron complex transport system substrate-binding protein
LQGAGTLIAGAAGVGRARAEPIRVADDRGVEVAFGAPARRLAAISYFGADVALSLGLKPVASTYMVRGRNPDFLLDHLTDVAPLGQRATPNLELLANARPDVIVAMRRYTEGAAAQYGKIAPYLAYNLELYGESARSVLDLATILGDAERGRALNERFAREVTEHVGKAPRTSRPRFQVMWGADTPWTFYSEALPAALLIALGGENVAGPSPDPRIPGNFGLEMSLETMLEKDPEVILVYDYGPDRPQEANPIWSMLTAVRTGRVHYVGDAWMESHGPVARALVLREAAHFLHPDVFPRPDPREVAASIIPASVK